MYNRQAYDIIDFVGDLGGVFQVIAFLFGLICFPISKFAINLKLAYKFYQARTSDASIFKSPSVSKKNEKKEKIKNSYSLHAETEIEKHYEIVLNIKE